MCSPTMRSGPLGRRTSLRATLKPSRVQRLGDVGRADGAEQLAFGARLGA